MKPVPEDERLVSIGFTVSLKMLRRIDELRGKEPRSPFIRRLLQRGLEAQFPEEPDDEIVHRIVDAFPEERGGENREE